MFVLGYVSKHIPCPLSGVRLCFSSHVRCPSKVWGSIKNYSKNKSMQQLCYFRFYFALLVFCSLTCNASSCRGQGDISKLYWPEITLVWNWRAKRVCRIQLLGPRVDHRYLCLCLKRSTMQGVRRRNIRDHGGTYRADPTEKASLGG